MIVNDPQFGPLKNKIDRSIPPIERRDKRMLDKALIRVSYEPELVNAR